MVAEEAQAAGLDLAKSLTARAVWHDGMCAFPGAVPAPRLGEAAHWRMLGGDFYEGSAGIARFLALAASLGAGDAVATTARGAIAHALARTRGWSLMVGTLGTGLVAMEVGRRLNDPELETIGRATARRGIAEALDAAAGGQAPLDLLAGLAGALYGGCRLAAHGETDLLPQLHALGLLLSAAGVQQTTGRAWPMLPGDETPLCGLAHGAAGVALAFEALGALEPGMELWAEEADAAREFERSHFDHVSISWADLRRDCQPADGGRPPAPHFWCHGSVGIALERLAAVVSRPDDGLTAADLAAALMGARLAARQLLAGPQGPGAGYLANGSICHGLSGFIDLLVETGDALDRTLALRLADFAMADSRRAEGWRCGLPSGESTAGLMLGLAGIGWGLLRSARPEMVPAGWDPSSGLGRP